MRAPRLVAVAILLVAPVTACTNGDDDAQVGSTTAGGPLPNAGGPYPVVDVIDGDTLKVATPEQVTVRVIGINTPETVDPRRPVECLGQEASARAHELLDGEQVYLESDPTQDRVDRFGRTLAYVWLPDGSSFGETMIADGFANEYTYETPYKYQDTYDAAERDAQEAERGLWAPSACA